MVQKRSNRTSKSYYQSLLSRNFIFNVIFSEKKTGEMAIPIKCFVSHRPLSREGGSVGRAKKKKRMNT